MRLKEHLKERISDKDLSQLSNRFQIIGDIAVISIPPELEGCKKDIALAITTRHRNIETVLRKTSKLEGDRRVAAFELLVGKRTVTVHREFGFVCKLDVSKVFFNSHLSYERNRIASKVRPGETVLVPFCGVGPFAIPIASKGVNVFALETNPEACRWLVENVKLNRVEDNVVVIKGDAFAAHRMLKQQMQFDRAVVPTPYGRDGILEAIAPLVKCGGAVHFYTFKKPHQIEGLVEKYESMGFGVELFRRCGNVAPGVCRWAFDLAKH
jgi:tRNA (guanine37-N1)-methyltransferase